MFINWIWIFKEKVQVGIKERIRLPVCKICFHAFYICAVLFVMRAEWGYSVTWLTACKYSLFWVVGTGLEQTEPVPLVFAHLLVQMPHESLPSTVTSVVLPIYVSCTVYYLHAQRGYLRTALRWVNTSFLRIFILCVRLNVFTVVWIGIHVL
jgi:hypothetical protein